jgi:hypothetical protein
MMVVPIRCSPVVGASPAAAAEEEPGCAAAMAGAARSAACSLVGSGEEAERSGASWSASASIQQRT